MFKKYIDLTQISVLPFFAVIAVFAYTIFLQFFTEFHALQNGDSIILSIMSYTKPTMYYWGQDQYLNFLPILFSFERNPNFNLLLISSFQLSALLLFPFFASKVLSIENMFSFGAITILCLAVFNGIFWFEFCYQPWTISLLLVITSLWFYSLLRSTAHHAFRLLFSLLSAIFAIIALKVAQPSIIIFVVWVAYLTIDRKAFSGGQRHILSIDIKLIKEQGRNLFLLILMFCLLLVIFSLTDYLYVKTNAIPKRTMLLNFDLVISLLTLKEMLIRLKHLYVSSPLNLLLLATIYIFLHVYLLFKEKYASIGKSIMLFLFPAIAIMALMSSLEWVRGGNQNAPRYLIHSILLLSLNFSHLAVEALKTADISDRMKKRIFVILLSAAIIIIPLNFRLSSFMTIRERIIHEHKLEEPVALAKTLDGMIGNYWKVWPAVWSVNAGDKRDFFGVADRTINIMEMINEKLLANKRVNLLALNNDHLVDKMLNTYFKSTRVSRSHVNSSSILEVNYMPVTVAQMPLPTSGFQASIQLDNSLKSLNRNSRNIVPLRIRNVSNVPWPAKGQIDDKYAISLSYHWLDLKGKPVIYDGVRTSISYDMKPNEELTLFSTVHTPRYPGKYVLEFDMVQEAVSWFKEKGSKTTQILVRIN